MSLIWEPSWASSLMSIVAVELFILALIPCAIGESILSRSLKLKRMQRIWIYILMIFYIAIINITKEVVDASEVVYAFLKMLFWIPCCIVAIVLTALQKERNGKEEKSSANGLFRIGKIDTIISTLLLVVSAFGLPTMLFRTLILITEIMAEGGIDGLEEERADIVRFFVRLLVRMLIFRLGIVLSLYFRSLRRRQILTTQNEIRGWRTGAILAASMIVIHLLYLLSGYAPDLMQAITVFVDAAALVFFLALYGIAKRKANVAV